MHSAHDGTSRVPKVNKFQKLLEAEFALLTERLLSELATEFCESEVPPWQWGSCLGASSGLASSAAIDAIQNEDSDTESLQKIPEEFEIPSSEEPPKLIESETPSSEKPPARARGLTEYTKEPSFLTTGAPESVKSLLRAHRFVMEEATALLALDVMSFFVICSNLVIIGWQLQYEFEHAQAIGSEGLIDCIFCVLFLLEILARLWLERIHGFFTGRNWQWNCFDCVVVGASSAEAFILTVYGSRGPNLTIVRTTRLLRLSKIMRAIRILRLAAFFRQGRLFMQAIRKTGRLLGWVSLMSFLLSYFFAVLIGSRSVEDCQGIPEESSLECKYFGSVWRSLWSVYQAMLGGLRWGVLFDALQPFETIYRVIFIVYMTFLYCVVTQIVIGVFVVNLLKENDHVNIELEMESREQEEQIFFERLVAYFKQLDVNGNGTLCEAELKDVYLNKDMLSFMGHHNLDIGSLEVLFDLLDRDSSGAVDMVEFVEGCVRLRGQAKAVEVERIRRGIKDIQHSLDSLGNASLERDGKSNKSLSSSNKNLSLSNKNVSIMESKSSIRGGMAQLRISALEDLCASTSLGTQQKPWFRQVIAKAAVISKSVWGNERNIIPKTEMRAMKLSELLDVLSVIDNSCTRDGWIDTFTEEVLLPTKVSLHHFAYYVIAPQTAAPSITLTGLKCGSYQLGANIKQFSQGRIVAEGQVCKESQGPDVEVKLLRGQFLPQHEIFLESVLHFERDSHGAPDEVLSNGVSISYKELVSSSPTKPDWYVSHWWGESILDFVICCKAHYQLRRRDKYWVCAYANRQHELDDEIKDDPENSSFAKAMRLAEGVLLLLDPSASAFSRIWCNFEIFQTINGTKMLDIAAAKNETPHLLTGMPLPNEPAMAKTNREKSFPVHLLMKGLDVKLEEGGATREVDRLNILNSMGKHPQTLQMDEDLLRENLDKANKSLRGYFALAAWPQALKRGLVRNVVSGDVRGCTSLSAILADDNERTYVQLSLSGLEEMDDEEMRSVAEGLPRNLTHLNLSFEDCNNITDVGVSRIADKIASLLSLQKLELYFTSCSYLTDASFKCLILKLPASIVDVTFNFSFCPRLSKVGLKETADNFPRKLKSFRCSVFGPGTGHRARTITSVQQLQRL